MNIFKFVSHSNQVKRKLKVHLHVLNIDWHNAKGGFKTKGFLDFKKLLVMRHSK
jgi:hypothetical protein